MSSSSSAPTFHFLCLFCAQREFAHSCDRIVEIANQRVMVWNAWLKTSMPERGYLMHMTYETLPVEALKSHISSRVIRTCYDHEHSCLNLISSLWTPTKMMDFLANTHLFVHGEISIYAVNVFLEVFFFCICDWFCFQIQISFVGWRIIKGFPKRNIILAAICAL